ncbi:hypothetical protein MSAN_02336800 [Mycena sanguinolenta]|uniref:Uncharacterized protein n=1 Tax=Mycena sanguinolenta TaxID=230812 RepID=A0A8H7CG96_9AGAR|nr:hypothetical protein MSAN_02336800 [Mycena sanguinolenta]
MILSLSTTPVANFSPTRLSTLSHKIFPCRNRDNENSTHPWRPAFAFLLVLPLANSIPRRPAILALAHIVSMAVRVIWRADLSLIESSLAVALRIPTLKPSFIRLCGLAKGFAIKKRGIIKSTRGLLKICAAEGKIDKKDKDTLVPEKKSRNRVETSLSTLRHVAAAALLRKLKFQPPGKSSADTVEMRPIQTAGRIVEDGEKIEVAIKEERLHEAAKTGEIETVLLEEEEVADTVCSLMDDNEKKVKDIKYEDEVAIPFYEERKPSTGSHQAFVYGKKYRGRVILYFDPPLAFYEPLAGARSTSSRTSQLHLLTRLSSRLRACHGICITRHMSVQAPPSDLPLLPCDKQGNHMGDVLLDRRRPDRPHIPALYPHTTSANREHTFSRRRFTGLNVLWA